MMIRINTKDMVALGRIYERLYRLPLFGERLVRAIVRGMGKIVFYSPLSRFKYEETIGGVRRQLEDLCNSIGIPISVIEEEPEHLEFLVHDCPYAYHRSDQQGVCDAVMDLDRVIFRLCGAQLTIQESVVKGAAGCRVRLRKI